MFNFHCLVSSDFRKKVIKLTLNTKHVYYTLQRTEKNEIFDENSKFRLMLTEVNHYLEFRL